MADDIPTLTLRVLENIQGELVTMKTELVTMKTELVTMKNELVTMNRRFDNFLTFVGSDVQDLKARVTALEAERKPRS